MSSTMRHTAILVASAALLVLVALSSVDARQLHAERKWTYLDPEVAPPVLEDGEGEALRPGYHITAQQGWMNDPNGMFEYHGLTHIFYQWNPAENIWGSPSWGHVVSADLVHWKRLPPALVPDTFYDYDGVFSGSASLLPDGTPILLYTGVSNYSSLEYYYQRQAAAIPADSDDPELKYWLKKKENPLRFELPAGATHAQFRDPTTVIAQGGRYWTTIGGQPQCVGAAILYSSKDFIHWKLEGNLLTQVGLDQTDGQCPVAATKTPGNRNCDQKGAQCRTWECPDIFEVDGVWVFKYSDQVDVRHRYSRDWYVISKRKPNLESASTVSKSDAGLAGIFEEDTTCSDCGRPSTPRVIDHGDIYASKSWLAADGRRLWIGWAFETAKGCFQQCSEGTPYTEKLGWQGAQTVPRVVTFDEASGSLLFNPVKEVADLRLRSLFKDSVVLNKTHKAVSIVPAGDHTQFELVAKFSPTLSKGGSRSNFSFGAEISTGKGQSTTAFIKGTISGDMVTSAGVFVDRSSSGGATNTTTAGGTIHLPRNGLPAKNLKLHILVDRSMLEVFALGGRARITTRIYPKGMLEPKWGVSLVNKEASGGAVHVEAQVWELSSCWVSDVGPYKKKKGD